MSATKTSSNPTPARRYDVPELNLLQKAKLLRGSLSTEYFSKVARPMLYEVCGKAAKSPEEVPEMVHELALQTMHDNRRFAPLISPFFMPHSNLIIKVNGVEVLPFGTAAGMDKNGHAFAMLDVFFGFQEQGTVIVPERYGNPKPRVAVDPKTLNMYNAQGFPHFGLKNFVNNISEYRTNGGKAIIYANICGLPLSPDNAIAVAMKDMTELIIQISPYVQGFVWNPSSPNTDALKILRVPEVVYDTSKLMKRLAPEKLRLMKIPPYEIDEKDSTLFLIKRFLDGGGHGIVTTNTKMVTADQLPENIRNVWGHKSAGRSGAFLKPYRARSTIDIRNAFPYTIIVGTGGIRDGPEAYSTFIDGATMIEGYTNYALFGTMLVKEQMDYVSLRLKLDGFRSLEELQKAVIDKAESRRELI